SRAPARAACQATDDRAAIVPALCALSRRHRPRFGAAVPTVANWSMSSIPRAIPVDTVRQLLASINRRTAVGRRNYALVLVLARLGLRASEVVHLELDDIDWDAGQVSVRGKGGYQAALPLPADVGAAMAAYLRHGRPLSTCRRVFL